MMVGGSVAPPYSAIDGDIGGQRCEMVVDDSR